MPYGGDKKAGFWRVGSYTWTTMDLDGDGRADLVYSGHYVNNEATVHTDGTGSFWKVYLSASSGFSKNHTRWTVPATGGDKKAGFWKTASYNWATLDLDGDGRPDLVSSGTYVNNEAQVWGLTSGPHWRLYRNVK